MQFTIEAFSMSLRPKSGPKRDINRLSDTYKRRTLGIAVRSQVKLIVGERVILPVGNSGYAAINQWLANNGHLEQPT